MLLDEDHKSPRASLGDGYESAIWYPSNVHGHVSAIAERVRPKVIWGKTEAGHANPS